jgi:hypothetical protein
MLTEEEVFQRFVQAVKTTGGTRAFGRRVGFTPSYISDLMHKRRMLSDRILEEIGIERTVTVTTEYKVREQKGTDTGTSERGAKEKDTL